jgi:hypothetical protein
MQQSSPIATQIERNRERIERSYWPAWTHSLKQFGLDQIAAVFLEAAGPLNVLLAQFVYIGQPFLQNLFPGGQVQHFARLLEDPNEASAFAAFLQMEEPR